MLAASRAVVEAKGDAALLALPVLRKVLAEAATDPSRRVLLRGSATFAQLSALPGALAFLEAAGFEQVSQAWAQAEGEAWALPEHSLPLLLAATEALRQAEAEAALRASPPVPLVSPPAPLPTAPPIAYPPMDEALVAAVLDLGFPEVHHRHIPLSPAQVPHRLSLTAPP